MTLYGVEKETERQNLRRLAANVRKRDWWSAQGPLLHDDLKDYLTLEADSSLIRTYEAAVVPGLLQTEAYMAEIFRHQRTEAEAQLMRDTRLQRQQILGSRQFRLRAVLDVTLLHSVVGSPGTMAAQLDHLVEMAARPNIDIQVLPLRRAIAPDQYTPFTIFSMRGRPPADYVWLEHLTSSTALEQRRDVRRYTRAWDDHTAAAMPPADSAEQIRAVAESYRTES